MRVRWEVEDTYCGKARPHYIDIDDEDVKDLTEDELNTYIEELVQNEFDAIIGFYWRIE